MYAVSMHDVFRRFATSVSHIAGSAWAFILAIALIGMWLITGPMFAYSDTWQLAINTTTTIMTFLMVFLIQNTQNRDAKAMHLKLDELIRAIHGARNVMVDIEELDDEQLNRFHVEFEQLHRKASAELDRRRTHQPKNTTTV